MDILNSSGTQISDARTGSRNMLQTALKQVADHKYVFLISIATCLAVAFFVTRYTRPVYLVKTSVLIKEPQNTSSNPQNLLYGEAESRAGGAVSIAEEVAILQSQPFIYRVLDALNMRVTYFKKGRVQSTEVYDLPYEVSFVDSTLFEKLIGRTFAVTFIDAAHFNLCESNVQTPQKTSVTYALGDTVKLDGCSFILNKRAIPEPVGEACDFEFGVNDLHGLAVQFKNQINIRTNGTESAILDIFLATEVPQKGLAFLNEYTKQYIHYKYEEKSRAISQSLSFINSQLNDISRLLGNTENNLERFKTTNTFSDASRMNERSLDALTDLDKERMTLALNERYYTATLRSVTEAGAETQLVAPASVGIDDKQTEGLIEELARLQFERKSYGDGTQSKNPLVTDIDTKITAMRTALKGTIASLLNTNRSKLAQVQAKSNQHQTNVASLPRAERKFVDITRANSLNEQIFLFLSHKQLEAGIIKAATTVESRVIETAMLDSAAPLKPKKENNYAMALLAGVAIPFGLLWGKNQLRKTVATHDEVQHFTTLPSIGAIYHNRSAETLVITAGARTAVAESFRLVRSYLTTIAAEDGGTVILISSMDSGEGKSFCAVNIAASLALLKKKTVLLNLDLRAADNAYPFDNKGPGISAYLNETALFSETITPTNYPYLDYISNGPIQQQTSELLTGEKVSALLHELKKNYAFIIIDSPPLGKVADPFIVAKYTDLNLVVVRLHHTTKANLFKLEQLYKTGRLVNASVLLNDAHLEKHVHQSKYYQ